MADFVQTMKDWRRLCETIQSQNQEKQQSGWCKGCPLQGTCIIDTDIKDCTVNVFTIIGKRIETWVEENPESVYPTWWEYLRAYGVTGANIPDSAVIYKLKNWKIPADIAEKLGLEATKPKPIDYCRETYRDDVTGELRIRKTPIYPIEPKEGTC